MGLDAVEIILRTEEVFDIDLPDDECGQVRTVNDLYTLVLSHLQQEYLPATKIEKQNSGRSRLQLQLGNTEPWNPPDVWRTLKAIIEDQLQVDPEEITPEARFVEDLRCD